MAPDPLKYMRVGEKELTQNIMKKYNLSKRSDIGRNDEARIEFNQVYKNMPYTEEWIAWKKTDNEQNARVREIIKTINEYFSEDMITSNGAVEGIWVIATDEIPTIENDEEEKLVERIKRAQEKFQKVAEFLKQKYFES